MRTDIFLICMKRENRIDLNFENPIAQYYVWIIVRKQTIQFIVSDKQKFIAEGIQAHCNNEQESPE